MTLPTLPGGQCRPCGMWRTSKAVKVWGEGPESATLVLVGEGLGEEEELQARPFVGRAGGLLNQALAAAGLLRSEVYITNGAKCRPINEYGRNRAPTTEEITYCRGWLDIELLQELSAPNKVIVTLGRWATVAVLGEAAPTGGVTENQGRVLWSARYGCWVVCSLHPAFILRRPGEMEFLVGDLMLAARIAAHGWDPEAEAPAIDYVVALTNDEAAEQVDRLLGAAKLAFDWETTGLHPMRARGFCLAVWGGSGPVAIFPRYGAGLLPLRSRLDQPAYDAHLQRLLGSDVPKIGHHVAFDCKITRSTLGLWPVNVVGCTMLKHQLGHNHLSERAHGLKRLAHLRLGVGHYKDGVGEWLVAHGYTVEQVRGAARGRPDYGQLWRAPNGLVWPYAAIDAWGTFKLDDSLEEDLTRESLTTVYRTERVPLALAYARIDRDGIPFDRDRLDRLDHDLEEIEAAVVGQLQTQVGWKINPNSSQQMQRWLYTELDLPVLGRTDTGQPSTREEYLLQLVEMEPSIMLALHAKAYDKLKGAFVRRVFHESLDADGRARPDTLLHVVETFRLATRKPLPIHTIPRPLDTFTCPVHGKYRFLQCCPEAVPSTLSVRSIIVPYPGHVLVGADFVQQEYVIMAIAAGQTDMETAILDRGEDAHEWVLEVLSGRSKKEFADFQGTKTGYGGRVTPLWTFRSDHATAEYKNLRSKYKQINFMIMYRGGAKKLARSTKTDVLTAATFITDYYERLSDVKWWQLATIQRLRSSGRAWSLFHDTFRVLPGIASTDRFDQWEAERQACNFPIQEGGARVMIRGLLKLYRRWLDRGWIDEGLARILFTVHDEVQSSVRRDLAGEAVQDYHECLSAPHPELVGGCKIPRGIPIDVKVTEWWDGPTVKGVAT